jgi:leader peptidase (prepilin peptidase)/N-methyltransferase
LTAVLFVACYFEYDFGWMLVKTCALCFLVLGHIYMDAETGLLSAEFTYPGIVLGLVLAWLAPTDFLGIQIVTYMLGWHVPLSIPAWSVVDAAFAALICAGFFYLAWALYFLARKRDGLGFGDVAFIAMIGAFLGLKLALLVVFLAPLLGTLYVFSLLLRRARISVNSETQTVAELSSAAFFRSQMPFGVFLGISALLALFWGETIWSWYLGFFRLTS